MDSADLGWWIAGILGVSFAGGIGGGLLGALLAPRTRSLAGAVDTLQERVAALERDRERVDALERDRDAFKEALAAERAERSALTSTVGALAEAVTHLTAAVEKQGERFDAQSQLLGEMSTNIANLQSGALAAAIGKAAGAEMAERVLPVLQGRVAGVTVNAPGVGFGDQAKVLGPVAGGSVTQGAPPPPRAPLSPAERARLLRERAARLNRQRGGS